MEHDGEVSIRVKQEHLEKMEKISKASGVPVRELIERAISLYLEKNKPDKQ